MPKPDINRNWTRTSPPANPFISQSDGPWQNLLEKCIKQIGGGFYRFRVVRVRKVEASPLNKLFHSKVVSGLESGPQLDLEA